MLSNEQDIFSDGRMIWREANLTNLGEMISIESLDDPDSPSNISLSEYKLPFYEINSSNISYYWFVTKWFSSPMNLPSLDELLISNFLDAERFPALPVRWEFYLIWRPLPEKGSISSFFSRAVLHLTSESLSFFSSITILSFYSYLGLTEIELFKSFNDLIFVFYFSYFLFKWTSFEPIITS